jgi:hypothetical protein
MSSVIEENISFMEEEKVEDENLNQWLEGALED